MCKVSLALSQAAIFSFINKHAAKLSSLALAAILPAFGGAATAAPFNSMRLLAQQEVIGDDGYNKTYNDDSKTFQERMKQARTVPVVSNDNEKGGFYLGINGAFGPVFDAEPENKDGTGIAIAFEPGFVIQSDSFGRVEFGVQIGYSSFAWKVGNVSNSMAPITFLPRVGWGTSLSPSLMAIARLGFGMSSASQTGKVSGSKISTNSATGTLVSADYDFLFSSGKIEFVGGLGVVHHKYSWSDATIDGRKSSTDAVTNLNFVNLHGGVRIQF